MKQLRLSGAQTVRQGLHVGRLSAADAGKASDAKQGKEPTRGSAAETFLRERETLGVGLVQDKFAFLAMKGGGVAQLSSDRSVGTIRLD